MVVFFGSGNELSLHIGTTALVLLASGTFFFAKTLPVRAQALAFLPLTIGVSHGLFRMAATAQPVAASLAPLHPLWVRLQLSFLVLATVASIAVAWHLTRRSRGTLRRQAGSAPLN